MSNSSTLYTFELNDFTAWDAANVLEFATSQFAAIWLACDRNHVPRTPAYKTSFIWHLQWEADHFVFPYINISLMLNMHPTMPDFLHAVIGRFARFQTGTITAKELHDEFVTHCSPNNTPLRSTHCVVANYRYDWWKDRFDWLGLELPVLNMHEVMEMTQDHFEQLVDSDALFNQIVAVRAHLQHLGETMASLLEQKNQISATAVSTMSQLKAPIMKLEEALLDSHRKCADK
ncbi:uncharacterized protein F5891DRAFT_987241 [Suillus fuscotomentosus]|uniref:Uncharacterized protein n=1 Tax=Suillus fuscotomentosus TaxID=1912939 RepID=A0AAD4HDE0_9AGAM|nr:uncharacterized protein F5891DRAFT_987241 [Suillus fuscotomentosus]KAG1889746.1 hypothetical protein F5891DRAFT_987241 [Suillus fuscotomentosus]